MKMRCRDLRIAAACLVIAFLACSGTSYGEELSAASFSSELEGLFTLASVSAADDGALVVVAAEAAVPQAFRFWRFVVKEDGKPETTLSGRLAPTEGRVLGCVERRRALECLVKEKEGTLVIGVFNPMNDGALEESKGIDGTTAVRVPVLEWVGENGEGTPGFLLRSETGLAFIEAGRRSASHGIDESRSGGALVGFVSDAADGSALFVAARAGGLRDRLSVSRVLRQPHGPSSSVRERLEDGCPFAFREGEFLAALTEVKPRRVAVWSEGIALLELDHEGWGLRECSGEGMRRVVLGLLGGGVPHLIRTGGGYFVAAIGFVATESGARSVLHVAFISRDGIPGLREGAN